MYNKYFIDKEQYFNDLDKLLIKLKNIEFDAIVSLKRSGLIMGAVISNKYNKPLYVTSEINGIPTKFSNILLVDDKICTGKTITHPLNKLLRLDKKVLTASLYIEKDVYSDVWIKETGKTYTMWYEI